LYRMHVSSHQVIFHVKREVFGNVESHLCCLFFGVGWRDVQCDFWFWIIWGSWWGRDREAFAGNLGEAVDF
jgi:hypothetical protein